MQYSIIVPVYNQLHYTKDCVTSIINMSAKYDYELILVSNGSTDGTEEWIFNIQKMYSTNTVLCSYKSPLGYGEACNIGIRISRGEYIVLLNNDTKIFGSNWLDILAAPFKDNTVGITGPLLSFSPDSKIDFLIFFCVMFPKWIINKIGYLDSKAFKEGYGEDIDFQARLKKEGYKIVQVPGDKLKIENGTNVGTFPIWHAAEGTCGNLPKWNEIVNRNREILRMRHENGYYENPQYR